MTTRSKPSPKPGSRRDALKLLALGGAAAVTGAAPAEAKTPAEIDAGVHDAINELFRFRPALRELFRRASGVLVVPDIIKAGFIVGAAYGEGALLVNSETDSYWSYSSASLGFQAGAQRTRLALFIMSDDELARFERGDHFDLGAEAELTVLDVGIEIGVDPTALQQPIIAVVFGHTGLLGGASFQTGEYSRLTF